jgi:glycosyltransferase involved in cell wall biosynthesis
MRVLYLSQYFPPEVGATQTRAYEMARNLVRLGHRVTVLAEVPNHPSGIIPPAYRGKLYEKAELDGIHVVRVWVKTGPEKTFVTRMLFYLTYMLNATLAGLLLAPGRFDLIYASSPPLFVGGAALALSRLRRAPMVFEVRDLWPESAVQLGELGSARAVRLATQLEEACYRRARHIVVVTDGIRARLLQRGIAPEKVSVVPNGANTDLYTPQPLNLELRRSWGIGPERFVVLYAGLHGLAHGLETALLAAEELRDRSEILFLFIGDGPQKAALVEQAAQMGLPNVLFHDALPEVELPAAIAMADLGLDTRRRLGISQGTLPVKMFSYMACARPVLLSTEGESTELLRRAGAGVAVPPEDPAALAQAVLELQADAELRTEMGRRGRAYVEAHYSRQGFAHRLERLLQGLLAPGAIREESAEDL